MTAEARIEVFKRDLKQLCEKHGLMPDIAGQGECHAIIADYSEAAFKEWLDILEDYTGLDEVKP